MKTQSRAGLHHVLYSLSVLEKIARSIFVPIVFVWLVGTPYGYTQQLVEAEPTTTPDNATEVQPTVQDLEVQQQLQDALSVIETTRPITVEVRAGIVTLRGVVDVPRARTTAETIANEIPNILFVQNLVTVQEPDIDPEVAVAIDLTELDETILAQITSIFGHIEALEQVSVTVRAGVVRMRGTTVSAEARLQAADLASQIDGVIFVDNQITVATDVGDRLVPILERIYDFVLNFIAQIPIYLVALLVLIVFWFISRVFVVWQWPFTKMVKNQLLANVWRQLLRTFVFVGGILIVLDLLGATTLVGAVIGTAGVLGLAVGFAFRDIVENYLSSIILSFRKPFSPNDLVQIGDAHGIVVRMTTSDTVLMTLDGHHTRIPNSVVFKSIIANFTRNPRRRFCFSVKVESHQSILTVQRLCIDVLSSLEGVVADPPPMVRIDGLGDTNVEIRLFGWVDQRMSDIDKVKSEAIRHIKLAFEEENIRLQDGVYRVVTTPEEALKQKKAAGASHIAEREEVLDVSVDTSIEEQVEEERHRSSEENILDDKDSKN